MPNPTLTTAVEKIQPTAIIKLDGAFNDFHAKEVIGIIDDLWSGPIIFVFKVKCFSMILAFFETATIEAK